MRIELDSLSLQAIQNLTEAIERLVQAVAGSRVTHDGDAPPETPPTTGFIPNQEPTTLEKKLKKVVDSSRTPVV